MRILDRYTIKSFIPPLLYCLAAFIFMYIIVDALGHLDEILRNKVSSGMLIKYYSQLVPIIFVNVIPVAMLVSTIYVYSDLNKHNEITAMKSAGINVIKIAGPFLLAGIAVALLTMLINEMAVPKATITTTKIKQEYIEKMAGAAQKGLILKDVTLYGQQNRLYYIKEFDMPKRRLNEIIVLEHDLSNNLKFKISAKTGRWSKGKWIFSPCIIYLLNKDGGLIGRPRVLQNKSMDIRETPRDFYRGQFQAELMNYSKLAEHVKKFYKIDKRLANRLAVDLYYKTAFPFISFIVVLLGAGFGLRTRRGGILWGIGTSIFISFIYYGIMAILLALGKAGWLLPVLSAWGANLIFLITGIILLIKLAD